MRQLTRTEWLLFVGLAAALAITNLYTTLLTGWSEGGSIISVVVVALALRALGREVSIPALNLGQTMASAGGAAGVTVAAYAAVRMADPTFTVSPPLLLFVFFAMAVVGVAVGTGLRRTMVRYHFPSGTACAAIQKSVAHDAGDSRRSMRLLGIGGALAALATIPTKISLSAQGKALVSTIPLGSVRSAPIGIACDPIFFGIGLVVGPRIGGGLFIGSVLAALFLPGWLGSAGITEEASADWMLWIAIAVLAVPTFVAVAFARVFREPPEIPAGFTPGETTYASTGQQRRAFPLLAAVALAATIAMTAIGFGVAWYWAVLATLLSAPLCLINGRVTADTDINPLILVVIVLMTGFAVWGGLSAVMLLGLGIVGSTVVGFAIDTMQDYRTGFLLDQNPHHQTVVQLLGAVVGVAVAVPLVLLLDAELGFGPGKGLPSPGPQIYTGIAMALGAGGSTLGSDLLLTVLAVSVAGSALAFLSVWPPTARFVPSLFGLGMGLLVPLEMSLAVFLGGAAKWGLALLWRTRGQAGERSQDVVLVGSAIFAASALVTVAILGLALLLRALGLEFFYFTG